jgi:pimeloyl-ACP methyl ester carboxylesterase
VLFILVAYCIVAVVGGGCTSTYSRLKSEGEIPRFAPLVARATALRQFITRVPTTRPGEPVVNLAVTRTGNAHSDGPILVFVHGAFSDARAWRYMAGALGGDYTLWLVDLPGCGESDKPPVGSLASDGYGPTALADRLYQAVGRSLEADDGAARERPVVLVGHSLGALVVTRMLADPELRTRYANTRARVAGMFLVTPLDVAIEKPVPVLEAATHLGGLEVALGRLFGILRERLAEGVLYSYDDPGAAQREEVDRGIDIIRCAAKRQAMQAMVLQATPRRPGGQRPDWPVVDELTGQYANIDVPTAIVCGAHDETLPSSMGYKLRAQIDGATLDVFPDCMHSPHLEHPQRCADVLTAFLRRVSPRTRSAPGGGASATGDSFNGHARVRVTAVTIR